MSALRPGRTLFARKD